MLCSGCPCRNGDPREDINGRRNRNKQNRRETGGFLRIKIIFVKQRGLEKFGDADRQSLTKLVNDSQFDRIVGTVGETADGRFGYAAFGKKLVLGHRTLPQQLLQAQTNGLIEFQLDHHTSKIIVSVLYAENYRE